MNLACKITMVRFALLPVFIFFYLADFIPLNKLIAMVIFAVAAFTDFLDGYIARKYKMTSSFGFFLDTTADKLIVMGAMLLVVADGTVPAPYGVIAAIIIIGRDLAMGALRQIAATKNIVLEADKWGKYKAFITFISIPALMLLAQFHASGWLAGSVVLTVYEIFCYALFGVSVLLTIMSAVHYFRKNTKVFKEGAN